MIRKFTIISYLLRRSCFIFSWIDIRKWNLIRSHKNFVELYIIYQIISLHIVLTLYWCKRILVFLEFLEVKIFATLIREREKESIGSIGYHLETDRTQGWIAIRQNKSRPLKPSLILVVFTWLLRNAQLTALVSAVKLAVDRRFVTFYWHAAR